MAVSSDLVTRDGVGNIKLHPYLVAILRWCVSCVWSTASVLLHRLLTTPLPPAAAARPSPRPRAAGTDHLHPEPRVECVTLHTPEVHTIDVIFVHGLYGSLGNTWRQGDWRPKYKIEPNKVPLIDPSSSCQCQSKYFSSPAYESNVKDETITNIYENIKILPNEEVFVTENFNLLDQVEIVDNYEMQASFVRDLFKKQCGDDIGDAIGDAIGDDEKASSVSDCECVGTCAVGCGCVCDECYSSCWPRDWIKVDYPGARVISINYTSDPYLWRPLWVKGNKRLRLHERAQQMSRQLLALGVGSRPVVWVGHSKGGLFIKQIYCEAYEAYLKTQKESSTKDAVNNNTNVGIDNENNNCNRDDKNGDSFNGDGTDETSSNSEEDVPPLLHSSLWRNSRGFMFYSVPHRGSPLADIKTPITARSIELLEISKDCSLVLSLQQRWLAATARRRPAVRSLVETTRTLMSVLWLRIVSESSADAGIGALYGVSLDHREICKPSSRACLLYRELMALMGTALSECRCQ